MQWKTRGRKVSFERRGLQIEYSDFWDSPGKRIFGQMTLKLSANNADSNAGYPMHIQKVWRCNVKDTDMIYANRKQVENYAGYLMPIQRIWRCNVKALDMIFVNTTLASRKSETYTAKKSK